MPINRPENHARHTSTAFVARYGKTDAMRARCGSVAVRGATADQRTAEFDSERPSAASAIDTAGRAIAASRLQSNGHGPRQSISRWIRDRLDLVEADVGSRDARLGSKEETANPTPSRHWSTLPTRQTRDQGTRGGCGVSRRDATGDGRGPGGLASSSSTSTSRWRSPSQA